MSEREVELKLAIAEQDIWRLQRLPLLSAATRKKFPGSTLKSIYYDTPDLRLKAHGIALRLRENHGKWLQTIKTEGRITAGLHERPEWETETAANTFDFNLVPDHEVRKLLSDSSIHTQLRPVFLTEFKRFDRLLELADGTQCTFSLDRGSISAADKTSPIREIELELISGNPAALFSFARALLEHIPVRLEQDSKAARGFALVSNAVLRPTKATPIALNKRMTVTQGFIEIASACLDQLTANEAGVELGQDPEFVHQMRVATRRLRTAVRLFDQHIGSEQLAAIDTELKWLGSQLGVTRDYDVFLSETLPPICATYPNHTELAQLRIDMEALRQQAQTASCAAIQSRRYQQLLMATGAELVNLSQSPNANATTKHTESILDFAQVKLGKQHQRIKQCAKHLVSLGAEQRHGVRILGKRLRYAGEFYTSLFPAKHAKPYLHHLANLQSVLGALNDGATAMTILSQMHKPAGSALAQAWVQGAQQAYLAQLDPISESFFEQRTFW
ncbi:MAG: CHAD domain-containing protein [Burkholderiales bacterium]